MTKNTKSSQGPTPSNQLVAEKEIVDVIYEAGQMSIKTLIYHFRARVGPSKDAQRERRPTVV